MAVIHIPEAEAAANLSALLNRARAGEDLVIDGDLGSVRLVRESSRSDVLFSPRYTEPRMISEIIADMERNPSSLTLDGNFEADLTAVIHSHQQEVMADLWEPS